MKSMNFAFLAGHFVTESSRIAACKGFKCVQLSVLLLQVLWQMFRNAILLNHPGAHRYNDLVATLVVSTRALFSEHLFAKCVTCVTRLVAIARRKIILNVSKIFIFIKDHANLNRTPLVPLSFG